MSARRSREIRLAARPEGLPDEHHFQLVEVEVPGPAEGWVLLRNIYMSVDPYMRGRMADRRSYIAPFEVGAPLTGSAIGEIVASRHPGFVAGQFVHHGQGWRDYALSDGSDLRPVDPSVAPLRAYLGVLGLTSLTAYIGVNDIARPRPGETMYVSAAAGAVGQIACQIARLKGCRVVGSAGSPEKVRWLLQEARIDAAFDYREPVPLADALAQHCPDGIDVYFDNVGGEHLEAALRRMNPFGRVVMCGMISQYNGPAATPVPRNFGNVIAKRLTLQGFIVTDHLDRLPEFHATMRRWIDAGLVRWSETVVQGLEEAPRAFISLFSGANLGKMIVQIAPDPTARDVPA